MANMDIINDFKSFYNNLENNDVYLYLDCYSSYIMSRKDIKKDILKYRMNFIINYYTNNHNLNNYKNDIMNYYINNIKDNYLLPQPSPTVLPTISEKEEKPEFFYKKKDIDYEELDKLYLEKLEKIEKEKREAEEDKKFIKEYNKFLNYYDYYEYTDEDEYNYCSYDDKNNYISEDEEI